MSTLFSSDGVLGSRRRFNLAVYSPSTWAAHISVRHRQAGAFMQVCKHTHVHVRGYHAHASVCAYKHEYRHTSWRAISVARIFTLINTHTQDMNIDQYTYTHHGGPCLLRGYSGARLRGKKCSRHCQSAKPTESLRAASAEMPGSNGDSPARTWHRKGMSFCLPFLKGNTLRHCPLPHDKIRLILSRP